MLTQDQILLILSIIELVMVIFLVCRNNKNSKKEEKKTSGVIENISEDVEEKSSLEDKKDNEGNSNINYDPYLKVCFEYNSNGEGRMVLEPATKESYVKLHRDMWRWIAGVEKILSDYSGEITREALKDIWLYSHKFPVNDVINANCFCCEYAKQQREKFIEIIYDEKIKIPSIISKLTKDESDYCIFCPLNWSTVNNLEKCDIYKLSTDSFLCDSNNNFYYDYNESNASIIAELPMLKIASAEEWIQTIKERKI